MATTGHDGFPIVLGARVRVGKGKRRFGWVERIEDEILTLVDVDAKQLTVRASRCAVVRGSQSAEAQREARDHTTRVASARLKPGLVKDRR